MAGYSEANLMQKLGYKSGETVFVDDAPDWFTTALRMEGITASKSLPTIWAHGFFSNQADLEEYLIKIELEKIEKGLWVSWPKKTSGVETDLTEQTFRDIILPMGWVDIKVAAIDDVWSGLKFTRRKA